MAISSASEGPYASRVVAFWIMEGAKPRTNAATQPASARIQTTTSSSAASRVVKAAMKPTATAEVRTDSNPARSATSAKGRRVISLAPNITGGKPVGCGTPSWKAADTSSPESCQPRLGPTRSR